MGVKERERDEGKVHFIFVFSFIISLGEEMINATSRRVAKPRQYQHQQIRILGQ